MNNEWVQLDTQDLNKETTKQIRGVRVKVSLSPYDVPQMVRGYREPNSNFFVIELKYVSEEPLETKPVQGATPPIHLVVGKNSGRIYAIKVDVVQQECDAVRFELDQKVERDVLGALRTLRKDTNISDNVHERYKVTESVISNNARRILGGLASERGAGDVIFSDKEFKRLSKL